MSREPGKFLAAEHGGVVVFSLLVASLGKKGLLYEYSLSNLTLLMTPRLHKKKTLSVFCRCF